MAFHINPEGNAGRCKAQHGGCPYGSSDEHFRTRAEATMYAESVLLDEMGGSFSKPSENTYRDSYGKKLSHVSRPSFEALESLQRSAADRVSTDKDRSFKSAIRARMAALDDWWQDCPGIQAAAAGAGILVIAGSGIAGSIYGGHQAGENVSEHLNGNAEVVSVTTEQATLQNFDSHGKGASTMDLDLDGGTVTISSQDIVRDSPFYEDYAAKLLSENNEGKEVTVSTITYRETEDGTTHVLKNKILEHQTPEVAQKAADGETHGTGRMVGSVAAGAVSLGALTAASFAVMRRSDRRFEERTGRKRQPVLAGVNVNFPFLATTGIPIVTARRRY